MKGERFLEFKQINLLKLKYLLGIFFRNDYSYKSIENETKTFFKMPLGDLFTQEFINFLVRHRLISFFYKESIVDKIPIKLRIKLRELKLREDLLNLYKLNQTIDIYESFISNKLPVLIFKGLPLSIQIYGDFANRGYSSDIDILVPLNQLIKSVELLKKKGFTLPNDNQVFLNKNFLGSYSRTLRNQISLYKEFEYGKINIDLPRRT